jgi:large subunit ribosomal protein L21
MKLMQCLSQLFKRVVSNIRFQANEILKIERLNDQEGKVIEFKNVLFLNDDKTTEIGNPNIQGAK